MTTATENNMAAVLKTLEEIKRWMADSDQRHDLLADQIAALQMERIDSNAATTAREAIWTAQHW